MEAGAVPGPAGGPAECRPCVLAPCFPGSGNRRPLVCLATPHPRLGLDLDLGRGGPNKMHEISGHERPSDEPPTRHDGMSKRAKFTKLGKREPRTDNLFSFEQSTQDEASQVELEAALESVLEAIERLAAKMDALIGKGA